ncbi:MAG: hypothetical protein KDD43_11175 [Bdellovibrionales bacterium]|nr:hypothetical protein [Bdellovibrionales bacterium]
MKRLFTGGAKDVPEQGLSVSQLPPHTEVYILQRVPLGNGRYALYGQVQTGPHDGKKVWIPFDSNKPKAKLFTSDERDLLSFPVAQVEESYYAFINESLPVYEDTLWWTQTIEQLNHNDQECLFAHKFEHIEKKLTATNIGKPIQATDANESCPEHPQRKDGSKCPTTEKYELNSLVKEHIEEAAREYGLHPALLAGMIHKESNWDPFIENQYEKKRCQSMGKDCPEYKWSKGLGQFGKVSGETYGLDWTDAGGRLKRPSPCGKTSSSARSLACTQALAEMCAPYEKKSLSDSTALVPISCPKAMIFATAKHLKDAFPDSFPVWVKNPQTKKLELRDVAPIATATLAEDMRSRISYFQRGVRVVNSYVEHFDQSGKWPTSYGEAWATKRLESGEEHESPSKDIGYQMLTNEFVNRCHIWGLVGLCGDIASDSLIGQYLKDFPQWSSK